MLVARQTGGKGRQELVRVTRQGKAAWQDTLVCDCRMRPLIPGLSQAS